MNFKKTVIAAVAIAVAANASFAGGGLDSAVGDVYAKTIKEHADVFSAPFKSFINVAGRYGNKQERDEYTLVFDKVGFSEHGLNVYTGDVQRWDDKSDWETHTFEDENNHARDWAEYKITGANEGQEFFVTETDGGVHDVDWVLPATHRSANDDEHDAVKETTKTYKAERYAQEDNQDRSLTVESNFNSHAYYSGLQNYGQISYSGKGNVFSSAHTRDKIKEYNVDHIHDNLQAKQIVALTAAVAFDKFPRLTGENLRNAFVDNLGHDGIDEHTVARVLSPSANGYLK